jgi:hypothetical protein
MVTDFFGNFLQELGQVMNIPNLHPDDNNSCLIKFQSGIQVQLELERNGYFLVLGTDLGDVPGGKYRENVFCEALKANGLPYPRFGNLAYSTQSSHLVLFDRFNTAELKAQKLAEFFPPFIEKAQVWKDAISKGTLPAISGAEVKSDGGIFGLR